MSTVNVILLKCQEPEQLQKRIEILSSMTGSHFVFLLDYHDPRSRQQFNHLQVEFIKWGFKYVSSCQGGYSGIIVVQNFHLILIAIPACHDLVVSCMGDKELVDHNKSKCIDCINASSDTADSDVKLPFKRSFFTAVRNRFTGNNLLNVSILHMMFDNPKLRFFVERVCSCIRFAILCLKRK